jgi:hypothetical protein
MIWKDPSALKSASRGKFISSKGCDPRDKPLAPQTTRNICLSQRTTVAMGLSIRKYTAPKTESSDSTMLAGCSEQGMDATRLPLSVEERGPVMFKIRRLLGFWLCDGWELCVQSFRAV